MRNNSPFVCWLAATRLTRFRIYRVGDNRKNRVLVATNKMLILWGEIHGPNLGKFLFLGGNCLRNPYSARKVTRISISKISSRSHNSLLLNVNESSSVREGGVATKHSF